MHADETAPERESAEATLLIQQAQAAYQAGNSADSLALLRRAEAVATPKQLIQVYLYQGLNYVLLGETDRAVDTFEKLLRRDPFFRLDPVQFPPKFVQAFDRARERVPESVQQITLVTYRAPQVSFAPETELPEQLQPLPWYKKWWVWALAGGVIAGIVAATNKGTSAPEYTPPSLEVRLLTTPPHENSFFCVGEPAEIEATFSGGEAPYQLTWSEVVDLGTNTEKRTVDAVEQVQAEGTLRHVFRPQPLASVDLNCTSVHLEADVVDAKDNEGEVVRQQVETLYCGGC